MSPDFVESRSIAGRAVWSPKPRCCRRTILRSAIASCGSSTRTSSPSPRRGGEARPVSGAVASLLFRQDVTKTRGHFGPRRPRRSPASARLVSVSPRAGRSPPAQGALPGPGQRFARSPATVVRVARRAHRVPGDGRLLSGGSGREAIRPLWVRGGFPRSLLARTEPESVAWRREFVRSFVERDLP